MVLSPEDRDKFVQDCCKQARIHVTQELQWVQDLDDVTEDLLRRGRDSPWVGWFWVRLYGLLAEILTGYKGLIDTLVLPRGDSQLLTRPEVRILLTIRNACQAIRDALTDDEVVLLDYERHCQCHVHQDGYRLRVKGKNKDQLVEDRHFALLGKTLPVADVDAILNRQLQAYHADDKALAVAFAQRLAPRIHALCLYLELLNFLLDALKAQKNLEDTREAERPADKAEPPASTEEPRLRRDGVMSMCVLREVSP